jgi:serine/threonine protein kinase
MPGSNALSVIAKLTDFGLSRALDPTATHVSNYRVGTASFMAPEVVQHGRMTPASDIYSVGVIMWCMLTSMDPWVSNEDGTFRVNPLFPRMPPSVLLRNSLDFAYVKLMDR